MAPGSAGSTEVAAVSFEAPGLLGASFVAPLVRPMVDGWRRVAGGLVLHCPPVPQNAQATMTRVLVSMAAAKIRLPRYK